MKKNKRAIKLQNVHNNIYYLLRIPEGIRDILIDKIPGRMEQVHILGNYHPPVPYSLSNSYNITLIYHLNNNTYTKEYKNITEESKDELERLFLES